MSTDALREVAAAIQAGEQERARDLLRPILQQQPTADAWYLAARVAPSREHAAEFLRRALMLNPGHTRAAQALSRMGLAPSAAQPLVGPGGPDAPAGSIAPPTYGTPMPQQPDVSTQRAMWIMIGLGVVLAVGAVVLSFIVGPWLENQFWSAGPLGWLVWIVVGAVVWLLWRIIGRRYWNSLPPEIKRPARWIATIISILVVISFWFGSCRGFLPF